MLAWAGWGPSHSETIFPVASESRWFSKGSPDQRIIIMRNTFSTPRGRLTIYNLIIVASIFAVYGNIVNNPFHVFDDPLYVTNNYYVQHGFTREGVAWAFRSVDVANWHPLTWLSHMLDIEIFGPKPAGHYLTNILWHIVECLLLFRLVLRVGRSDSLAFAVALIWAVHPANVECVAWIAERKTLIASSMMLAGMIFYLRYLERKDRQSYLLCFMMQILAAMAKPVAVLFPVALVLIDGLVQNPSLPASMHEARTWKEECAAVLGNFARGLKNKTPFIAVAGYLSVVTFLAQNNIGATGFTHVSSIAWRCGDALESIFAYTGKSFSMPESSLLYLLSPLDGRNVFLGGLLVLLMVLCAIACYRRQRIVTFGLAWYLLMFLPTIGLVQVGSQRLADRYLGWPLIGLIWTVCYGVFALAEYVDSLEGRPLACARAMVGRWGRARVFVAVALVAWALGLGWQARALCVDWSDDLGLCRNAMKIGGISSSMLINCAALEVGRHDYAAARRFASIMPGDAGASLNLASADFLDKKYNAALKILRYLYTNKNTRLKAAVVSGMALDALGRHREAEFAYKGAIHFLPPERSYLLDVEELRIALPQFEAAARDAAKRDLAKKKNPDLPDAGKPGTKKSGREMSPK